MRKHQGLFSILLWKNVWIMSHFWLANILWTFLDKFSTVHMFHFFWPKGQCMLSCYWFFATLWTVACQAPLSMGFSRQEYWSGLPFPSPGDLSNPVIKPASPVSCIVGGFFNTEPRIGTLCNLCLGNCVFHCVRH